MFQAITLFVESTQPMTGEEETMKTDTCFDKI